MKSKDSPNLYEILRSARHTPGETPAAAQSPPETPSLQERLSAYKAAKLAASGAPAGEEPSTASPPGPATPVAEVSPSIPGGRRVGLTWNTLAFGGLVLVGFLFFVYSLGVRAGRAGASEAWMGSPDSHPDTVAPSPASAEATVASPAPPPPLPAVYTLRLAEWPYQSAQQRVKAMDAAGRLKDALSRAGHSGAESAEVWRGSERRLALYLGKFTDADAALAKLTSIRRLRLQNHPGLAQAVLESVSTPVSR